MSEVGDAILVNSGIYICIILTYNTYNAPVNSMAQVVRLGSLPYAHYRIFVKAFCGSA